METETAADSRTGDVKKGDTRLQGQQNKQMHFKYEDELNRSVS